VITQSPVAQRLARLLPGMPDLRRITDELTRHPTCADSHPGHQRLLIRRQALATRSAGPLIRHISTRSPKPPEVPATPTPLQSQLGSDAVLATLSRANELLAFSHYLPSLLNLQPASRCCFAAQCGIVPIEQPRHQAARSIPDWSRTAVRRFPQRACRWLAGIRRPGQVRLSVP
jgi:hypothetical protein